MEEKIKELTLLLLYLTSWKETDVIGEMRRNWKNYLFEDLIRGSKKSKSVYLTGH